MRRFSFHSLWLLAPFLLGLAAALSGEMFYSAERSVFEALRIMSPWMDIPFTVLTELGSAVGVISVTALLLIVTAVKRKYFFTVGLPVAVTTIVSRLINMVIKEIVARPRPDFKVLEAGEASFPSGHAQNNMALYISVLLVLLPFVISAGRRLALKITLIALPLIIGITRIYFGVHYVSDVIAGWGLGAFVAVITVFVYFKIYDRIKEKRNAKA